MTGKLSDLATYVDDAFRLVPAVPFTPENIVFGFYTFLPWVRVGLAQGVTAPPPGGIRPGIVVAVPVQSDSKTVDLSQNLLVRGPGDVVTFGDRQVVRRYPEASTTRAEDSFLAHVELDRPDFPWIFSPSAPDGQRLRPWIALVVVREARCDLKPGSGELPAQLRTTKSELQPLDDSWAWAHAQVVGPAAQDATTPSVDDRLMVQYAAQNLSRLICPRHLAPDEAYVACVVPTYDAGVQSGLGASEDGTLDPAWTRAPDGSDADDEVTLPAYVSWRFGCGPSGDFESLAEQLVAVPAPWQVGRRVLDVSKPGGELPPLDPGSAGRLQTVHGPLVSPQTPNPDSPDPVEAAAARAEAATWPPEESDALRSLLNTPDELALRDQTFSDDEIPLVGPEIYARHHARRSRVEQSDDPMWFGQLNMLPPNRVTAGLGTRVVQHDQEALMQSAWAQVGQVDDANRQLRLAQLARFVGESMHSRHLAGLAYGPLVQVTRAVHGRTFAGQASTLGATIVGSAVPVAAATSAFRRATRPRGALARFAPSDSAGPLADLLSSDGAPRDFQRPYREVDGITGVSAAASRGVDPAAIAQVLQLDGVDAATAAQALVAHGATLATTVAVPDMLTPAAVDGARPDPAFVLQDRVGARLLDVIAQGVAPTETRTPARVLSNLSLLSALQRVQGPVGQRAVDVSQALSDNLPIRFEPILHTLPSLTVLSPVPPTQTVVNPVEVLHPPLRPVPRFAGMEVLPDPALLQALQETRAPVLQVVPALSPIATDLVGLDLPTTPVRQVLSATAGDILTALHPATTVTQRMLGRLGALPDWLPVDWFDDGLVRPIMAAPVFTRPMYQALDALDREWLIPGLATLPEPDLVTVLVSNAAFVEAFLVGLSHEMGRELLWRSYPTDQSGTYFRRFFDATTDELQQDVHLFGPTPLGSHLIPTLSGRLVLLVRGELVHRYPNVTALAMRAGGKDGTGHPVFIDPATDSTAMAPILFHGHLAPDILLVGFDLTVAQVTSASWWFVLAEHPTAPRFGLAESRDLPLTRETVAWPDLPVAPASGTAPAFLSALTSMSLTDATQPGGMSPWGADAATTAHVLLRDPVRAAFDAAKLLTPTGAVP